MLSSGYAYTHDDVLCCLEGEPIQSFPLAEAARRGIGRVLVAEKDAILLDEGDGTFMLYAPNTERGIEVLKAFPNMPVLDLLSTELVAPACDICGLHDPSYYYIAIHQENTGEAQPCDSRHIELLDASYLQIVKEHYSHPEYFTDDELLAKLDAGIVLGGFTDDGELVGFIAEHTSGSIGMLEVFPAFQRQGWARSLVFAKVHDHLSRGWTPWGEINEDNEASLALNRALGLRLVDASTQCFLTRE